MSTIRVIKQSNFTQLDNGLLDDSRLSFKAVGLLCYMLRLPDDWDFTLEGLAKKHRDGLASVRSAMAELEAAGYVTRGSQQRTEGGTFQGADYEVREFPTACENRTRTACENPISVFPISENRTQNNIINTKTEETNIPPKAPQGAGTPKAARTQRGNRTAPDWEPELFARFWRAYPCGKDKQAAIRAWDQLKPDHALMRRMSAALDRDKNSDEWRRGIGIPYACRWLSKRRWEDEEHSMPTGGAAENRAPDPLGGLDLL